MTVDVLIPLSVPCTLGNESRYLAECVKTNWVSSGGPFVARFETAVAAALGVDHAVACVNGTAALHVALLAAGVEPDDEVVVSDLTFIASANAVRYCGAWPVLVDAEPRYWQLDVDKIGDFLTRDCEWRLHRLVNRATGRRVRAILPVHILGHPVDLAPIQDLARRFELTVVADAAEAIGTRYRGEPVGRFADLSAVSFNGNKLVTAGGGGAVATNDAALAQRIRYLTTQAKDEERESVHGAVGFNYRLTNIQAALGLAQLERLEERLESKRRTACFYEAALADLPVEVPHQAPWATSSWWLYTVLIDEPAFGMSRVQIGELLGRDGIETRPLWTPVSRQPMFADCQVYRPEHAVPLQRRSLSLPCSVGITDQQRETVVNALARLRVDAVSER